MKKILLACLLGMLGLAAASPLLMIGHTGAGKSSLADALLGCDPSGDHGWVYTVYPNKVFDFYIILCF